MIFSKSYLNQIRIRLFRRSRKFTFLIKLVFLFIIIFVLTRKNPFQDVKNPIQESTSKAPEPIRLPRNQDWEQLGKHVFFRRSGAYYLIDKSLLRVLFVSKTGTRLNFELQLSISVQSNKTTFYLVNSTLTNHDRMYSYQFFILDHKIDLLSKLGIRDRIILKPNISLIIKDLENNKSITQDALQVKLKYLSRDKKQGAAICTKCYFYTQNYSHVPYQHFEWWFELNKHLGYRKLIICNNTIPDNKKFRNLFHKYNDFLDVIQMNTYPDFLYNQSDLDPINHKYLITLADLKMNNQFVRQLLSVFDRIILNECYLDNAGFYSRISVIDNDETIIPRINPESKKNTDNYELISSLNMDKCENKNCFDDLLGKKWKRSCSEKNKNIISFIESVSKGGNVYFQMGFYLKDSIINTIVKTLEEFLKNNIFSYADQHGYEINVTDLTPASKEHQPYNYTFVLNNKKDFDYAFNLCKIYRLYIEDFFVKYKPTLNDYSNRFNRFFFLVGKPTSYLAGKTVHNTDKSSVVLQHYSGDENKNIDYVTYEYGNVAHFRDSYKLTYAKIPIQDLLIDFNYLFCYYRPIFSSFAGRAVF